MVCWGGGWDTVHLWVGPVGVVGGVGGSVYDEEWVAGVGECGGGRIDRCVSGGERSVSECESAAAKSAGRSEWCDEGGGASDGDGWWSGRGRRRERERRR